MTEKDMVRLTATSPNRFAAYTEQNHQPRTQTRRQQHKEGTSGKGGRQGKDTGMKARVTEQGYGGVEGHGEGEVNNNVQIERYSRLLLANTEECCTKKW